MVQTPIAIDYHRLTISGGFIDLPGWASLTLVGKDRQVFLHNFCTNDVRRLTPGECCEAFITNVKGRIIGHVLVTCREGELVLLTVPDQAKALIDHFDRYIIREDVQVRDTTFERSYLLLAGGPGARSIVMAIAPTIAVAERWQRPLVFGAGRLMDVSAQWIHWDLLRPTYSGILEVAPADAARARQALAKMLQGDSPCGVSIFHTLRIEAGMPLFGVDFGEENFPQEVGRDREAISFTKGCYLGQETVARIDALGHVNQRLVGVRFGGKEVPDPGLELVHSGKKVGQLTSVAFSPRLNAPLALAMVRREANAPGTRLRSAVGDCEVVSLPVGS